jgi:peptide/nickel transport system permease protein
MIVVLIAISILTFLIFQAIPNGDPAHALAGRTRTPETVRRSAGLGLRQADLRPVLQDDEEDLHGQVISYTQQVNVLDEIKRDLPATLSLAIGAGIIWLGSGSSFGVLSASRRAGLDRSLTVLALIGVSTPVFCIGALMLYSSATRRDLPATAATSADRDPWEWFTT